MTPDDPQKEFSLAVLSANFCCFVLISVCYAVILANSRRSSRNVNRDQNSAKLEAKVTIIILTEFICWIPITIACYLHYAEVIDATPWYPFFSTILLPLNSVINPILYNRKIEQIISRPITLAVSYSRSIYSWTRSPQEGEQQSQTVAETNI